MEIVEIILRWMLTRPAATFTAVSSCTAALGESHSYLLPFHSKILVDGWS